MGISVKTQPASEPVSLADIKSHVVAFGSDDDDLLTSYIEAARSSAEVYLNRALITQTLELTLDHFPAVINLPRCPVQSVTSITYTDVDGVSQTFTDFQVDVSGSAMAKIKPAYGYSWPDIRPEFGSVVVEYVAGYGDADDVPASIVHAIKLIVGSFYAHRENELVGVSAADLPLNAQWLLNPYRLIQI